ncbi:type II CRISPR RNA-guided endonuclease Cas9 [Thiobacillus sedimenti]|uniref:CRISPR-associated endonuclease Cas9 n=1 Tax=Thiobacillus sedimenti TaxID=3110231 RepID=A0ABZ1CI93_9PROT|nr:type II CRISPR RNA-guided endonuclease Cas9 [Thiobacillus sp. SCUT-2]WRS38591.1 type II CRISPR RNA-guided endonuclease Cas9 [Thiobacillus sp. SCUT-2]
MEDNTRNLTFGFDIGIASVGWAVLAPNRIVSLGVRAFDKAETAKEGEPLNLARRSARLMRRRLYRRAWRQTKVARLLKREGLIADIELLRGQRPAPISPWQLRVEGLDRLLAPDEWARVLYHLCKHRGFHWISRAEERKAGEDAKGEGGKVKKGLAATASLMRDKDYRTAAEMLLKEFPDGPQRNKQGDYGKALSRVLLADEVHLLFECQHTFGNPHTSDDLRTAILGNGDRKSGLFWLQKPALSGDNLLRMLGRCTFEKAEFRAPKASFTSERHVWLTRLNNLRIVTNGITRPLNEQERQIALPLPYNQAGDLTHKQLRAAMTKGGLWDETYRFARFSYAQTADGKVKDPESAVLVKLPAWQELRKQMKDRGLETEWQSLTGAAQSGNPDVLDRIAWVLSVYKDDTEVERELRALGLPGGQAMIDALSEIRFDKFSNLSLKALRLIVPHMEAGMRYDEACEAAGYHHSQLFKTGEGEERYLPPFYSGRDKHGRMLFNDELDIPRNPVVLRALNQARKVMNALIRKYGSPASVHIEMARDLSKPFDDRRDIKKEQDEYQRRNREDKARFAEHYGQMPKGQEFDKWRLYREQQGKCAYSIEPIDLNRLLEPGYVEIDHALPYSRSFDDSKNNKVLVLAKENRDKGNATPYEYLDGENNSERWQRFVAYVEGNKAYRLAKRTRLLRKNFGTEEARDFRERNLNDTRYISRFFKNYVERYLKLADGSESKRCVVLSGQLTAFLRARWGLLKIRTDSDRHHALDAVVVAACSHGMVKRLSDYSRRKELEAVRDGFIDLETGEIVNHAMYKQLKEHFPDPWPGFRHELEARLFIDNPVQLRAAVEGLGSYPADELEPLKPLFVSRAPQRRNGGAAHKDTIYAQPKRLKIQGGVTQKIPLASLTLKDLDTLVEPHRNGKLYAAIRERLEAHGGKGDKAFPAGNPLRKPDRGGNPNGPIVRSVTKVIDKQSGIPVRGGLAKNDSMLRVDVFTKDGKFHLVPVYVHHKVKGLPNRAIVAFKDEAEWTVIDDGFNFCFSLHPNDFVKVTQRSGENICGYYRGCHSGTGAINVALHDRYAFGEKTTSLAFSKKSPGKPIPNDKLGLIEGIGVKLAANIEKFHIDVLGNLYPAPPEMRRDLA